MGKLIVAKGFKSWPKCNKSPNLVSLSESEAKVVSWYGVVVSISSSAWWSWLYLGNALIKSVDDVTIKREREKISFSRNGSFYQVSISFPRNSIFRDQIFVRESEFYFRPLPWNGLPNIVALIHYLPTFVPTYLDRYLFY